MSTVTRVATQDDIERWARLSNDLNPLHCDPGYAAGTRFGGTILHGHMTVAWLMERALWRWGPAWLEHGDLAELQFRLPLRPDVDYSVTVTDDPESPREAALRILLPDGSTAVSALSRLREDRS